MKHMIRTCIVRAHVFNSGITNIRTILRTLFEQRVCSAAFNFGRNPLFTFFSQQKVFLWRRKFLQAFLKMKWQNASVTVKIVIFDLFFNSFGRHFSFGMFTKTSFEPQKEVRKNFKSVEFFCSGLGNKLPT